MAAAKKTPKITNATCRTCRRGTSHDVLAEIEDEHEQDFGEESPVSWGEDYRILRCRGCATVCFEEARWNSTEVAPDDSPWLNQTFYPAPNEGRGFPFEGILLPAKLMRIYCEALTALNADSRILATIGLRATVEAMCADQGAKGKNLEERIDDLVASGAIAARQKDFLHLHRLLGNDAAHELKAPEQPELHAAFDIIESTIKTLYALPNVAAKLSHVSKKLDVIRENRKKKSPAS